MFIATQGPLSNTIPSFWKLCAIKEIPLIIMLCNIKEDSRIKCEQYWPSKVNEITSFGEGEVEILLVKESILLDNGIIRRDINIKTKKDDQFISHDVVHLQVVCWPDHSVPDKDLGFKAIEMLCSAVDSIKDAKNFTHVLTHCSAGIGRTGSFLALYNTLHGLKIQCESNRANSSKEVYSMTSIHFNVFNTVRKLREQRFSLVTDLCQYKFIYEFALDWIDRNFIHLK